MMRTTWVGLLAYLGIFAACSASSNDGPGFANTACTPNSTQACSCSDGRSGVQTCAEGGALGACDCGAAPFVTVAEQDAGPGTCGDGRCNASTETCRSCARDCGQCPQCTSAPSCSNAVGIPSKPGLRGDLCDGTAATPADGGVDGGDAGALVSAAPNCKDPELRIRIERIVAHKGGGQIYCVLSASDGATSEVAITAKTKSLVDEQTHYFDPAGATFWGQKVLHPTTNNLTVSYNCFRVKGDSWSKVLGAMGDSAAKQAGSDAAGQYGWAFGAGSVAADAAAAAVQAGVGDELTFNAQQVIDKTGLMDLTNGRYWTIRKSQKGGVFGGGWDWEIFLQAWGCADAVGASR